MKRKSLFAVLALALCLVLLLSGCNNPLKKKAPEKNEPAVNLMDLEGVYSEALSHRGVLQFAAKNADSANIVINWPGSSNERAHWEMTGTYDAEKQAIVYSDAKLIEQTFADDGTQSDRQVSTNGTGSFKIQDKSLVWTDDNAYVGSDPTTFTWQMSLSDYMKTVTPEPTPAPTPTPTPAATPEPTPEPTPVAKLKEKLPAEPGCPIVTKDPTDETVKEGGSCWFVTHQEKANLARWRFLSPDGTTDLQFDEIGDRFPGLKVLQGEYDSMKLLNIPYELNGWHFYCRFTNKVGSTDSGIATITVQKEGTAQTGTAQQTGVAGAPVVTKSPTDETVKVGESAYFVAKYNNANLARWHFVSPDGATDVQYDEAGKLFPGVQIVHGEYSTMQLKNITKDLDGWKVYCRYSNKVGYTDTEMATITVTD